MTKIEELFKTLIEELGDREEVIDMLKTEGFDLNDLHNCASQYTHNRMTTAQELKPGNLIVVIDGTTEIGRGRVTWMGETQACVIWSHGGWYLGTDSLIDVALCWPRTDGTWRYAGYYPT